jgi:flavin reductase (DIM6/NTAB) family NADH-FMN oxidoreductase RutF
MHKAVELAILYFGTPVALISTLNEDGSPNIAPMSSAWWLGSACMLGLGAVSKTSDNLIRTRECVINLPSVDQAPYVDRLALTTGRDPVPEYKRMRGYRHEPDKFAVGGLTQIDSDLVKPPRILECPIHMEGIVHSYHTFDDKVSAYSFEVRIKRVHVDETLLMQENQNRVDPQKWKPLIMSFRELFGLSEQVRSSRLAGYPEELHSAAPR